jgi:hypothetical protein
MLDYRKFYDLEHYLFTEVGPRFAETGEIAPADFYIIIIWKANRAKTRVRDRLDEKRGGFNEAVRSIAASLRASTGQRERLEVLMKVWGFRLPLASAILTVLYPDDFSVYDVRVCGQLGAHRELAGREYSDRLWDEYQQFLHAVNKATPPGLSLRDRDRYLWGRSFYEDVTKDLEG